MKKLLVLFILFPLLTFLPILAFAANSVSIDSVSINTGAQTATVSGSSVYDTSSKTSVSFSKDGTIETNETSWSFTKRLGSGKQEVSAVNGDASDSETFTMPSNEGGLTACQMDGSCPTFAMYAPQIPNQHSVPANSNNRAKDGTLVTIRNLFELLAKGLL